MAKRANDLYTKNGFIVTLNNCSSFLALKVKLRHVNIFQVYLNKHKFE